MLCRSSFDNYIKLFLLNSTVITSYYTIPFHIFHQTVNKYECIVSIVHTHTHTRTRTRAHTHTHIHTFKSGTTCKKLWKFFFVNCSNNVRSSATTVAVLGICTINAISPKYEPSPNFSSFITLLSVSVLIVTHRARHHTAYTHTRRHAAHTHTRTHAYTHTCTHAHTHTHTDTKQQERESHKIKTHT